MFSKLKTRFMVLLCLVLFLGIFLGKWFLPAFAESTSIYLPEFYSFCNKIQLFPQKNGNSVLVGLKNNSCRVDILSENGQTVSYFKTNFSAEKAILINEHLFFLQKCGQHYGFTYTRISENPSFSQKHMIPVYYGNLMHCECDSYGRLYCLSSDSPDSILVLNSCGKPISNIKAENHQILSFSISPDDRLFIRTKNSLYFVNLTSSFFAYSLPNSFLPNFPLYFFNDYTAVDSCGTLIMKKGENLLESYKLPVAAPDLAVLSPKGYICSPDRNKLFFYSSQLRLDATQEANGHILAMRSGNKPFYILKKSDEKTTLQFISWPTYLHNSSVSSCSSHNPNDSLPSAETLISSINSSAFKSAFEIRIKSGTSLSYVRKEFFPGKNCRFFLPNNRELTFGKVRTGMKIVVKSQNESQTFILCVPGDITGSGTISSRDITGVYSVLLNQKKLSGIYARACDYDNDGKITTADLLWMKKSAAAYDST